ncbi:MAG: putative phosphodiesterase [Limisphaerales bacterium]|jgi:predicted phosphodiesterase
MQLGLIGDVHAHDEHLLQAIEFLTALGVDALLCTGDIVDGIGNPHRCIELLIEHNVKVVAGNHDRWLIEEKARHVPNAHLRQAFNDQELDYIANLPRQHDLDTPYGNLKLCHGVANNDLQKIWPGTERMPVERSPQLDTLLQTEEVRYLINGHMHYRTVIHFEYMTLINAGTLRADHRPGFSVLDLALNQVTGYEFATLPEPVRTIDTRGSSQSTTFKNTQDFTGNWQPVTLYA